MNQDQIYSRLSTSIPQKSIMLIQPEAPNLTKVFKTENYLAHPCSPEQKKSRFSNTSEVNFLVKNSQEVEDVSIIPPSSNHSYAQIQRSSLNASQQSKPPIQHSQPQPQIQQSLPQPQEQQYEANRVPQQIIQKIQTCQSLAYEAGNSSQSIIRPKNQSSPILSRYKNKRSQIDDSNVLIPQQQQQQQTKQSPNKNKKIFQNETTPEKKIFQSNTSNSSSKQPQYLQQKQEQEYLSQQQQIRYKTPSKGSEQYYDSKNHSIVQNSSQSFPSEYQQISLKNQSEMSKKNVSVHIPNINLYDNQPHLAEDPHRQPSLLQFSTSRPTTQNILKTSMAVQNQEIDYWKKQYQIQLQQKESLLLELSERQMFSNPQNPKDITNSPLKIDATSRTRESSFKKSPVQNQSSLTPEKLHFDEIYTSNTPKSSQISQNQPVNVPKLQRQYEQLNLQYKASKETIQELENLVKSQDQSISTLQQQLQEQIKLTQSALQQQEQQQQKEQQQEQQQQEIIEDKRQVSYIILPYNIENSSKLVECQNTKEWKLKTDLASLYKLNYSFKYSQVLQNNISTRLHQSSNQFLLGQFGLRSDEITPNNIISSDQHGNLCLPEYLKQSLNPSQNPQESYEILNQYIYQNTFFNLHNKIYHHNAQINCLFFLNSEQAQEISQLKSGVKLCTQDSLQFYNKISYFELSDTLTQKKQSALLAKNLEKDKQIIIIKNQGILITAQTLKNLFLLAHNFMQYATKYVQSYRTTKQFQEIPKQQQKQLYERIQKQKQSTESFEWAAFQRELEKRNPNWKQEKGPVLTPLMFSQNIESSQFLDRSLSYQLSQSLLQQSEKQVTQPQSQIQTNMNMNTNQNTNYNSNTTSVNIANSKANNQNEIELSQTSVKSSSTKQIKNRVINPNNNQIPIQNCSEVEEQEQKTIPVQQISTRYAKMSLRPNEALMGVKNGLSINVAKLIQDKEKEEQEKEKKKLIKELLQQEQEQQQQEEQQQQQEQEQKYQESQSQFGQNSESLYAITEHPSQERNFI